MENVLVSYSINENEYVEFELVKTENGYEIKYI